MEFFYLKIFVLILILPQIDIMFKSLKAIFLSISFYIYESVFYRSLVLNRVYMEHKTQKTTNLIVLVVFCCFPSPYGEMLFHTILFKMTNVLILLKCFRPLTGRCVCILTVTFNNYKTYNFITGFRPLTGRCCFIPILNTTILTADGEFPSPYGEMLFHICLNVLMS